MHGPIRRQPSGTTNERAATAGSWRRLVTAIPAAQEGQSMVEFAMVVPIFLSLVFAIIGFGLVFQNKIAMDNAVRDGVRWASAHSDAWPGNASGSNTIQAHVQNSGGIASIPTSGINITYSYVSQASNSTGTPVVCGTYNGSGPFQLSSNYNPDGQTNTTAFTEKSCLVAGQLITVSATIRYQLPLPVISKIISAFFPGGLPIQSSATMEADQSCAYC